MTRRVRTLAGAAVYLAALPASAQLSAASEPAKPNEAPARFEAELAADSSRLSNGSPDWHALSLRLARTRGPRDVQALAVTNGSRFGLQDQQIGAQVAAPVSERLTATFGAQASPSHRVLARYGVNGNLQYEFAPAWLVHGGAGFQRYNDASVTQGNLMLEHYFSSFSAAAAWRPVRALGVGASSVELRGAWYYSDASSLAVVVSRGDEATAVAASRVELADVRSLALFGRHWISPAWSLSYALARTRQGNFYNLTSFRLGAQYVF